MKAMAAHVPNPKESGPNAATTRSFPASQEQATEEQKVREAQSLDAKTTYEVIRREGEKELDRSTDAWRGEASWADALAGFVLPSHIGNMVGGITLVTALNHAQATSGH
jgi:hypothetical protein